VSQDPDKPTEHTSAEARGAELREELAITDERRAEEEEAKAEKAVEDAVKEESKKERKRREAEERRKVAAAEAEERRRAAAAEAGEAGQRAQPLRPPLAPSSGTAVEGPERPEFHVAATFAGAFLFARILKKIAD
jgi:colicin import membrane protein